MPHSFSGMTHLFLVARMREASHTLHEHAMARAALHCRMYSHSLTPPAGGAMLATSTTESKQQQLRQGGEHSATAHRMPSGAKASREASMASSQPVEQSLAARRAKTVYAVMERSAS